MKISGFNKGILSSTLGSLWWGFLGTFYFKYISSVGAIEVVAHRSFWTCIILLVTTLIYSKWKNFIKIIFNIQKMSILILTSFLIFGNWSLWIYAVSTDRIIEASFGYFIFPIISVFFGFIFFNEKLNFNRIISLILVVIASIFFLINVGSLPWIGLTVALLWSVYNLLRKKINVDTDIGLLIESLILLPVVIFIFYFLVNNNLNHFVFMNFKMMLLLFLAGPMTVIPLFLYVKGVELSGLGPSGMIFFITPTGQFLLGFFYYNESINYNEFLSFILIWIAVSIYLKDLYENN